MSIPKDAKELFDEQLPAALKAHPDKAKEVNAVYGFKISGDGGGEWTVDLVSDPPAVIPGTAVAAQCTIEIAHEDFTAMLATPALGMQLFFQGKLKVVGDPMLATKLQKFLTLGQ